MNVRHKIMYLHNSFYKVPDVDLYAEVVRKFEYCGIQLLVM